MPTYPPAHRRVQFQGTLEQAPGGGTDLFDFGFADDGALTLAALCAALGPIAQAYWNDSSAGTSVYATLRGVRAEEVAADGKVTDSFYQAITPTMGEATGNEITILCQAVTLETATPDDHGRMVRGRMFPPAWAAQINGSTCTVSDASNYNTTWGQFLSACNAAGAVVSVASVTAGGQIAHVTGTSVGTVIDTQRRRKNHVTVSRTPVHAL